MGNANFLLRGHGTVFLPLLRPGTAASAPTSISPFAAGSTLSAGPYKNHCVDIGADLDAHKGVGWTPLMVAAEAATGRVIRLLVERGADRGAKDRYGLRAFHWAYRANREYAILDLLALPEDFGHQEPTHL